MSAKDCATQACTTKRPPSASGGKVGEPQPHLTENLFCVPLMPITAETVNVDKLESPREAKETMIFADDDNTLPDIKEGDLLTISTVDYIIRSVGEWVRPQGGSFLHLAVEEQKGT